MTTDTKFSEQVREIAKGFEAVQEGLHKLAITTAQAAKNAESLARVIERDELLKAEEARKNEEAKKAYAGPLGAFTGITKLPATPPGYPTTTATFPTPAPQPNVADAAKQARANLTDEARKLINTGASYDRAIAILTAKYPLREREHIRRAVGRANGGKN